VEVGEQEHRSPDGHYRWDGQAWLPVEVAVICQTCGAGLTTASGSTSMHCHRCGSKAELRRCASCSTTVHVPSALVGKTVTCRSCGRPASWSRWQAGPVTAGEASAEYMIPQAQVADPDRRIVEGIVVAAAGIPPFTQSIGCKLEFNQDCVLIHAYLVGGGYQVEATLAYDEVEFLGVGGVGATSTTTGGGWIGGGFGLEGMAAGILFASAMNLLTERTHTSVETIVHLRATGARELVMLHSVLTPTVLQVCLAGVFERLPGVRPLSPVTGVRQDDAAASMADPVDRLERLARLHRTGALSDEEFERAKQATLEAL
jgi:DNA-directed RNA polymerase subunit RPC12/RpoP